MPVGIVSKNYGLVQHAELFQATTLALTKAGIDLEKTQASLTLTEYGARMRLGFTLPENYNFDPGDSHPMALRLECFNSVDGSSRLWVVLGWLRFVCGNGLVLGTTHMNIRRVHNGRISVHALEHGLKGALARVKGERRLMGNWVKEQLGKSRLEEFADTALKRKWGVRAAARFLLICETGHDGSPKNPFQKGRPSELKMKLGIPVPGTTPPVKDAFAAAQSLAWLAQQKPDIQKQLERTKEIPALMGALLQEKN